MSGGSIGGGSSSKKMSNLLKVYTKPFNTFSKYN